MTLGTILYILLFFVSVFISIMYLEFGAMALMGLMVTIPVCMFLFLLVLRKRVSVSVDSKNPLAEKEAGESSHYAFGRKQKPSASGDERNCQGSL